MSNSLQQKALNLIEEALQNHEFLKKNEDFFEIFEVIKTFSNYKKIDEARNLLNFAIMFQNSSGEFEFKLKNLYAIVSPVFFLSSVSVFLANLEDKNEVKSFVKPIKRAIKSMKKSFNEDYLLFEEAGTFYIKENAIFLSFADELSDVLNSFEYTSEADEIFMMKGKAELGMQRYFFQKERGVLVKSFNPELRNYEVCNSEDLCKILRFIDVEETFEKKFLKDLKNDFEIGSNVEKVLEFLLYLKVNKDKSTTKIYGLIEKFIVYFPAEVVKVEDYDISVEKSLFFGFEENSKELKKSKMMLVGVNNLKVARLVLDYLL